MMRCLSVGICLLIGSSPLLAAEKSPPEVGETAPDFELMSLQGETLQLSELTGDSKVVLVVLRGFPGYQCPACRRQSSAFQKQSAAFREAGATVVMVYPGDVTDLNAKALQFLGRAKLPDGVHLVLDPGYVFTNSWNLRWDAENETAYPSTYVIDKDRKVVFAKVSKTHGGRTNPDDVLQVLKD